MKGFRFVVCTFLVLMGCASPQSVPLADKRPLDIGVLKEFVPRTSTEAEALAHFGEPDRRMTASQNGGEDLEIWVYLENLPNPLPRLSFVFGKESKSLVSIKWEVYSRDSEKNLEQAKLVLGTKGLKKNEIRSGGVDWSRTDIFFTDAEQGIKIQVDPYHQVVTSIARIVPQSERAPSATLPPDSR